MNLLFFCNDFVSKNCCTIYYFSSFLLSVFCCPIPKLFSFENSLLLYSFTNFKTQRSVKTGENWFIRIWHNKVIKILLFWKLCVLIFFTKQIKDTEKLLSITTTLRISQSENVFLKYSLNRILPSKSQK